MSLPAGLLADCAGQKRLADTRRPGDQDVLMLGDPATRRELPDERMIKFPATARIARSRAGSRRPNSE